MDYYNNNITVIYGQKFGQIAINMNFATIDQIKEALEEQIYCNSSSRLRPRKLIGEILFENGWMTEKQIKKVLNELTDLPSNNG